MICNKKNYIIAIYVILVVCVQGIPYKGKISGIITLINLACLFARVTKAMVMTNGIKSNSFNNILSVTNNES